MEARRFCPAQVEGEAGFEGEVVIAREPIRFVWVISFSLTDFARGWGSADACEGVVWGLTLMWLFACLSLTAAIFEVCGLGAI